MGVRRGGQGQEQEGALPPPEYGLFSFVTEFFVTHCWEVECSMTVTRALTKFYLNLYIFRNPYSNRHAC
jgi:hypothetical protein